MCESSRRAASLQEAACDMRGSKKQSGTHFKWVIAWPDNIHDRSRQVTSVWAGKTGRTLRPCLHCRAPSMYRLLTIPLGTDGQTCGAESQRANEAREIRTPNLLIWSQTRCRCAIAPCFHVPSSASHPLHDFVASNPWGLESTLVGSLGTRGGLKL